MDPKRDPEATAFVIYINTYMCLLYICISIYLYTFIYTYLHLYLCRYLSVSLSIYVHRFECLGYGITGYRLFLALLEDFVGLYIAGPYCFDWTILLLTLFMAFLLSPLLLPVEQPQSRDHDNHDLDVGPMGDNAAFVFCSGHGQGSPAMLLWKANQSGEQEVSRKS